MVQNNDNKTQKTVVDKIDKQRKWIKQTARYEKDIQEIVSESNSYSDALG